MQSPLSPHLLADVFNAETILPTPVLVSLLAPSFWQDDQPYWFATIAADYLNYSSSPKLYDSVPEGLRYQGPASRHAIGVQAFVYILENSRKKNIKTLNKLLQPEFRFHEFICSVVPKEVAYSMVLEKYRPDLSGPPDVLFSTHRITTWLEVHHLPPEVETWLRTELDTINQHYLVRVLFKRTYNAIATMYAANHPDASPLQVRSHLSRIRSLIGVHSTTVGRAKLEALTLNPRLPTSLREAIKVHELQICEPLRITTVWEL